jgi:cytochrome c553
MAYDSNAGQGDAMKIAIALLILPVASILVPGAPALGEEGPPAWAYPVNPPDLKLPADDGTLRRVPDSDLALTLTQVRDRFYSPDWHPGDHPAQPEVVARGRKPDVFACGFCHRADGPGGPENANLTGLPAAYIIQQVADFKSGARQSAVPNRDPIRLKTTLAHAITDAEVEAAAAYFASIKPRSIVRVIETEMAPKSYITGWHLAADQAGGKEPIGERVIEVPDDLERFVSRDTRSTFTAHVPLGSIEKGRDLAAGKDAGKTVQCGVCHGPELKGLGPIPGIAGRSPSYIVRQLYDFQHGLRTGTGSALMMATVEKLTIGDMISLAAYAASLPP